MAHPARVFQRNNNVKVSAFAGERAPKVPRLARQTTPEVLRPTYADPRTQKAATVIGKGFIDDRLMAKLGVPPDERAALITCFAARLLRKHCSHPLLYATACGGAAAIVCPSELYGKDGLSPWEVATSGALGILLRHPQMLPIWYRMAEEGAAVTEGAGLKGRSYLKLAMLATLPECQGQGLGSALLDAINRDADAAGLLLFLEASNEDSARLYERKGYTTVRNFHALEATPSREGHVMPMMVRMPGARAGP